MRYKVPEGIKYFATQLLFLPKIRGIPKRKIYVGTSIPADLPPR
jgi:hypothetical protein